MKFSRRCNSDAQFRIYFDITSTFDFQTRCVIGFKDQLVVSVGSYITDCRVRLQQCFNGSVVCCDPCIRSLNMHIVNWRSRSNADFFNSMKIPIRFNSDLTVSSQSKIYNVVRRCARRIEYSCIAPRCFCQQCKIGRVIKSRFASGF